MKCTNCGKNNASYHYKYNINGNITEAHLCPECAAKLAPEKEFAAKTNSMFGNMFDGFFNDNFFNDSFFNDSFFGDSLFGRNMFSPMLSFGMPAMLMPRIEIRFPGEAQQEPAAPAKEENSQVDPELSRKREINALREQMKAAAEAEDYEKAAELRDKLRGLEKGE